MKTETKPAPPPINTQIIDHPGGWLPRRKNLIGAMGVMLDRVYVQDRYSRVRIQGRRRPLIWPARCFGPCAPPPNPKTYAPPRPDHLAVLQALNLSDVMPRTAKEIAKAVDRRSVRAILNRVLREGWVAQQGAGRKATYALTTAGRERMSGAETYARLRAEWMEKYPLAAARLYPTATARLNQPKAPAKPAAAKPADPAWEKTVARNHALPVAGGR